MFNKENKNYSCIIRSLTSSRHLVTVYVIGIAAKQSVVGVKYDKDKGITAAECSFDFLMNPGLNL